MNVREILISTDQCNWNKETRTLTHNYLPSTFPEKVRIVSSKTFKEVLFHQDEEAAIRNEFWDGEMSEYKSSESDIKLFLTHF